MCPRLKVPRKVSSPPVIKGFKPYGPDSENRNPELVNLLYEEYEAIRLSDYDKLNHHQASVMMNVSRPTFTRIYASALQKIATAFIEGRTISIEGGKVYFDSDWYHCEKCRCNFNNPEKEMAIENCPLCGSQRVDKFDYEITHGDIDNKHFGDMCICPNCGFEQKHQNGTPCNDEVCPKCDIALTRKVNSHCRNF